MTCSDCTHWTLKNRMDKDARAMARLHLVNCAHGPAWLFYPPHATCPRHQEAAPDVVKARQKWLGKAPGRT